LPSGHRGPAFLLYPNFDVLLEWNRSLHYGLAAGYLANRLTGEPPMVGRAPSGDRPLARVRIAEMQRHLTLLGYDAGEADGMVGARTRNALQDWQRDRGVPADAYPTPEIALRIAAEARRRSAQIPPPGGMPGADVQHASEGQPEPSLPILTAARAVSIVQAHLNTLGYQAGPPDGIWGPRSASALRRYLADRDLPSAAGVPSQTIAEQLAAEVEASQTPSAHTGH
jgi:peptidoglycan hydrolase-like protein with peptidoglycan-binding domain